MSASESLATEITSWHAYTSPLNLGHRATADLFDGPVLIEEKIDGSQFSFGVFNGDVKCRSSGQQIDLDNPGMFAMGVASVKARAGLLHDGWTYRGEFLSKPKHNSLGYERHPNSHIILFDVNTAQEAYLTYDEKAAEASRVNLEVVPRFFEGELPKGPETIAKIEAFLANASILGDVPIEGVVIKNYAKFNPDGKALVGKLVSASFRELHAKEWKTANPCQGDIVVQIVKQHKTEARWQKAVQHLTEAGKIDGSLKDIGTIIKEIPADLRKDYEVEIKEFLFAWAWPQISRMVVAGAAEWYKQKLQDEVQAE